MALAGSPAAAAWWPFVDLVPARWCIQVLVAGIGLPHDEEDELFRLPRPDPVGVPAGDDSERECEQPGEERRAVGQEAEPGDGQQQCPPRPQQAVKEPLVLAV